MLGRTAYRSSAIIVIALFLASFLPQHQHLSDVAVLPGLIPSDAQTTDQQTDIFIIICIGFQEALSLLVYRNLWYMDAQVCFLKVLFKTWIDHFFQLSTEISSMDVGKH